MNWSDTLRRASLILGLVSLALATPIGIHLQHLIDGGGGRHVGEAIVFVVLSLLAFAGSRYGLRGSA